MSEHNSASLILFCPRLAPARVPNKDATGLVRANQCDWSDLNAYLPDVLSVWHRMARVARLDCMTTGQHANRKAHSATAQICEIACADAMQVFRSKRDCAQQRSRCQQTVAASCLNVCAVADCSFACSSAAKLRILLRMPCVRMNSEKPASDMCYACRRHARNARSKLRSGTRQACGSACAACTRTQHGSNNRQSMSAPALSNA